MTARVRSLTADFARDERGVVGVLFALSILVLVMIIGVAIDEARLVRSNSKLAAAADAAALAAGRAMLDGQLSDADVVEVGEKFFRENLLAAGEVATINGVRVLPNRQDGTVMVTIDADVPMTLTRVAGFETVGTPVRSVTDFDQRDIELGMALDITGSMGGRKIQDLKIAAKDLIDILLPDGGTTNTIRIGLAPYSASIRLGAYADLASGGTSTDGCVRERAGHDAPTDAAPAAGHTFAAGGSPVDIDPTEGRQGYVCPGSALTPLTDEPSSLKSTIDGFVASGATAGHIGAQWAWNLVSPEWSGVWPAASRPVPYGEAGTLKAVILMTDGIFNTSYANGHSGPQALSVCSAMKDQDVVVYTVAFQAPRAADDLLRNCATSPETHFNAGNGDELRAAFQTIANTLNNLRLTQ